MEINRVVVGDYQENCYILSIDNKCLVIDPGDEKDKIINAIGNNEVLGILITHHHFDHVGALEEIKNKYNVDVYDYNLKDKEYNIGPFNFSIIKNPGHTDDSISFYFEKENTMFVGDFVFKESIGRCDLGGNYQEMEQSINKLKALNKDITLYPGHGDKTNLLYEIKNNPYF